MTIVEAYDLTLEKLEELKKEGVEIIMKPSNSREDKYFIKKYNKPDRISPEKWFHVTFNVKDEGHLMKINKAANYLGMCGIRFDTGGFSGYRDWSFRYTGKEDEEWRNAREEVEDLIKNND